MTLSLYISGLPDVHRMMYDELDYIPDDYTEIMEFLDSKGFIIRVDLTYMYRHDIFGNFRYDVVVPKPRNGKKVVYVNSKEEYKKRGPATRDAIEDALYCMQRTIDLAREYGLEYDFMNQTKEHVNN